MNAVFWSAICLFSKCRSAVTSSTVYSKITIFGISCQTRKLSNTARLRKTLWFFSRELIPILNEEGNTWSARHRAFHKVFCRCRNLEKRGYPLWFLFQSTICWQGPIKAPNEKQTPLSYTFEAYYFNNSTSKFKSTILLIATTTGRAIFTALQH